MKEFSRLAVVLTLVCAVSAFVLSYVHKGTKDAIAYQNRLELLKYLEMVLPEHDNEPDKDVADVSGTTYYLSRLNDTINGISFIASSEKGYSGVIRALIGVDPEGKIIGVVIMEQHETPGLGSKITSPAFLVQFKGRNLDNTRWQVKKDGGDIDQISGATISPRALTSAIKEGLEKFKINKSTILGGIVAQ